MIFSPGRHSAQSRDELPISSAISEISPRSLSTHAPVSASPSVTRTVSSIRGALALETLNSVEASRSEAFRSRRGTSDDLDDRRRQAVDGDDGRDQKIVEAGKESAQRCIAISLLGRIGRTDLGLVQLDDVRIPILGAGHGFDDVAGIHGVVVAV